MKDTVSYCGLICAGCPVLWATHEKDQQLKEKMKAEIAVLSNKLYATEYGPEDITDCDGCMAENGRLLTGCEECRIRKCAREKKIPNCAHCDDYICDTLDTFLKDNPEAKSRLDFIRSLI